MFIFFLLEAIFTINIAIGYINNTLPKIQDKQKLIIFDLLAKSNNIPELCNSNQLVRGIDSSQSTISSGALVDFFIYYQPN